MTEVENKSDAAWEETYRDRIKWDRVAWGTHCVDCYPSNCPHRVYVRGGRIIREEAAGTFETIEEGVPDMNPAGCQKGACWSQMLEGKERLLYPLRPTGERGEGSFEPYQYEDWQDFSNLEPGLVKWLHLAGSYGHLQYRVMHWQPIPIDRAVRVDIAP